MPAAITEFVDINVVVGAVSPERFSFGNYMGVFQHSVTSDRQNGPYFSVAEAEADGFTIGAAPEINRWLQSVFNQEAGVDSVLIGRKDVGDADWAAALDAIALAAGDDSWYGHTIGSRLQSDIEDVAAWTESRFHFFIPQSDDTGYLNGTPGNVGAVLEAAGYKRTAGPLYHAVSTGSVNAYADGAWASVGFGQDLDAPGGRGIWAYKQLTGIIYDNITATQANNIFGVNGNIYGRNKGLSFTSKGTTAYGIPYFIDIQTTIDWIKARLEEDILALFVSKNVIPYTNAGINLIAATVKARLDQGVTFGHFSPDFQTEVNVPDVANVSSIDKQNRELSIQASAVFAGAIQKLTLNLNLAF